MHSHPRLSAELKKQASELMWRRGVLRLGSFVTKSSRPSPYFFDTSRLYVAPLWRQFVGYYLQALRQHDIAPEHVTGFFGAAYKGIPLATTLAELWYESTQHSVPFAFSRKELKEHGEGGRLVGELHYDGVAAHQGGMVVCDDVLTSGKSLRQTLQLLDEGGFSYTAVVVAVDRGERDDRRPHLSARQALEEEFKVPLISVLHLDEILAEVRQQMSPEQRSSIQRYLQEHSKG